MNPNPERLVFDPYEPANRQVHEFNKGVDKAVVKPVSRVYATVTPQPFRMFVSNGVRNLSQPTYAINLFLQGDLPGAAQTVSRFTVNTIFGVGGIADPATDMGLFERPTDFGETLAVWGIPQGAYVELPLLGPSSERDATGKVVDYLTNPVYALANQEQANYLLAGRGLKLLDDRQRFAAVIDALLYESADSYTAARLAYLQNKKHSLKGETQLEDLEDPYAE
ncbi:MAG: VacJ family lipoprotein [Paracoccaceae bacterium]